MLSAKEALLKTVVKDHWVIVRYRIFWGQSHTVDYGGRTSGDILSTINPTKYTRHGALKNVRIHNNMKYVTPTLVFHGTKEQCQKKQREYTLLFNRKYSYYVKTYEDYKNNILE